MEFNFPRTKFVDKNTLGEQLKHLKSEINEFESALTYKGQAEELLDVLHSAETLFRVYIGYSPYRYDEIEKIKKEVIQKNKERGYYDTP